jgi:hypothetical protein
MLSCLFLGVFKLSQLYLETARNFGFHSPSNRKEKEFKCLPNAGKSNEDSLAPVWSLPHSLPSPTNLRKKRTKRKSHIINAQSHKLKVPVEDARQQGSLHIS